LISTARIVNRIHGECHRTLKRQLFPPTGDRTHPAAATSKLLAAADRALYRMKHRGSSSIQNLSRIAACL
jgi:hypothetical protein